MSTLLLPVAGRSSRFPGMRPKWLLTMPDGKLMFEKAIEMLDLSCFKRIVIVVLREHLDLYLNPCAIDKMFEVAGYLKPEICVLDSPTSSQSETVALGVEKAGISGPFFIKDCDNMFKFQWDGGNQVAVIDLNEVGLIDAKSKSYIEVDPLGNVSQIVEKQVISNYFCCGGYGFDSAEMYLRHYQMINKRSEVYISHVIYSMLMDGQTFRKGDASTYVDWGTLREYRYYTKSYVTIFCDIDGVLLCNGNKFGKKGWATQPIVENLKTLVQLQKSNCLYLIVTSSRPESEVDYIKRQLEAHDLKVDRYIMGLPHSRRVLVNDYSATNPYPSAVSINLERDSTLLSHFIESIYG